MSRDQENALLAQQSELRKRSREVVQRIVEARLAGSRDDAAISELRELSKQEVELVAPAFAAA